MIAVAPDRPLLVFGGPYSNLQATEALIARAGKLGIPAERAICTGDVVAYGADPEATVSAIRAWGCHVIAGNCEEQLATGAGDCGCGFEEDTACATLSKGWYPFANARVSAGSRAWMAGLPSTLRFEIAGRSVRVVHGTAGVVNRFVFASEHEALTDVLDEAGADIVLAGHCGLPFVHRAADGRVWLNAGVIGMPANDGTPDGWYTLIEPTSQGLRVSFHRLAYDFGTAAARMRREGHANPYARTLITGLWPSLDILPETERAATGVRLDPMPVMVAPVRSGRPTHPLDAMA